MFSLSQRLLRLSCRNRGAPINSILRHFAKALDEISKAHDASDNVHLGVQDLGHITNSVTNKLGTAAGSDIVFVEANSSQLEDELYDIPEKIPGPLDECTEDISYIGPYFSPTHTFAKYANKSRVVQELVKLGVELHKLERNKDVLEMFLKFDFEKDVMPYVQFLTDCGVRADHLGFFITKNPKIFQEDMDDLRTRIRYLKAHKYSTESIAQIITRNPIWLSHTTKYIDEKLGYFQQTFKLKGFHVRTVSCKCPKLITNKMFHIKENTFAVKEEMGFQLHEMRKLLVSAPSIWAKNRNKIVESFNYAHNVMKLQHETLVLHPAILLCRVARLELRHKFLVQLHKDQYDATKPMYVSPTALVSGSDIEFCQNVAKTSIELYNKFLKS